MRVLETVTGFLICFALHGQPNLSPDSLELRNVKAKSETYLGRPSLRPDDQAPPDSGDKARLAIFRGSSFLDGTIEIDVGNTQFERFYIRPKNGRSPDQLQRNHSTQYISVPAFPWAKTPRRCYRQIRVLC